MQKNTFIYPFLCKNLAQKKIEYKKLWLKAQKNNIYFASLKEGQKNKIKRYNLTKLKATEISNVFKKDKKPVFFIKRDELISPKLPPFGFVNLVLSEALKVKYKGPLYIKLSLEINSSKYIHTLRKEINITKKQIKNARQIGIFNINIDLFFLEKDLAKEVFENLRAFVDFLENKTQKQPVWNRDEVCKNNKQKINLNNA